MIVTNMASYNQANFPRVRFRVCLIALGGALGVAATLITFIIANEQISGYEIAREPEHLAFAPALFFGGAGGIAGALIIWPMVLWLSNDRDAHGIRVWAVVGLMYGLVLPFITGALLPASHVLMGLSLGIVQPGELLSQLLSSFFRIPVEIVVHGGHGILTGMLVGVVFGVGAWTLDQINWSRSVAVARIGPWTLATLLGTGALALALFGPPDTLTRLG